MLGLALIASGCGLGTLPQTGDQDTTIRIGYPITTLINGQIGQILERTNILQMNGVRAKVVEFTHGPPTNEALAAGRIDVGLTSEGPAVLGISQGIPAVVTVTFGTTRDGLVMLPDSAIHTAGQIRGKTIGVPFGTTPFLHLVGWLRSNGLTTHDVKLVNIAPEELAAALIAKSADAVEYNEPLPTQLEMKVGARVVASDRLAYALMIRRDFLSAHRQVAIRFTVALAEAVLFMARKQGLVDQWFATVSRSSVAVVHEASLRTPAYAGTTALSQVDLGLSPEFIDRLQQDADAFVEAGFAKSAADMHHSVDAALWQEAKARLASVQFDPNTVKIGG